MSDFQLKFRPITSGIVGAEFNTPTAKPQQQEGNVSFQDVLKAQLEQKSNVAFSKHAVQRAASRDIDLTEDRLQRLNEGMRLANEKNLDDALILIDETAFIVNAPNNMVITATNRDQIKGNVFTNINGTVII